MTLNKLKINKFFNFQNIILFIVVVISFFIYCKSLNYDFLIGWDDDIHITENNEIKDFSKDGIKEIFLPNNNYLYHPITMLSFAINYQIGKLNPYIYHLSNILLHLLNILLVYFLIKHLSGNKYLPIIVTVLFAFNPLSVEPIVWISGRKDVLYAFFYLLTLIIYTKYLQSNIKRLYVIALLIFILSILSKPSAIVLPFILLLIDYLKSKLSRKILLEKIPFFLFAIIFGILPYFIQRNLNINTDISNNYVFFLIDYYFPLTR